MPIACSPARAEIYEVLQNMTNFGAPDWKRSHDPCSLKALNLGCCYALVAHLCVAVDGSDLTPSMRRLPPSNLKLTSPACWNGRHNSIAQADGDFQDQASNRGLFPYAPD